MTGGFIILAVLSWAAWLARRRKPAVAPPPSERIVEARIRIGAQEPRMGHPSARKRGFECIEKVPE